MTAECIQLILCGYSWVQGVSELSLIDIWQSTLKSKAFSQGVIQARKQLNLLLPMSELGSRKQLVFGGW